MTITPELSPNPNRQGLHTVYLRVTENRKHKRISTGVKIEKKFWNPKGSPGAWIRKTHVDNRILNSRIRDLIASTSGQVVSPTVAYYVEQFVIAVGKRASFKYKANLQTYLGRFTAWVPVGMKLSELTPIHCRAYLEFLLGEISVNSALRYVKAISQVLALAEKEELITRNPFLKVDLPRKTRVQRIKLSEAQIASMREAAEVGSERTWDMLAVDMFELSFYAAGIRAGDMIELRVLNIADNRLTYEMNKNGKLKSVPLNEPMRRILDKYLKGNSKPTDYIFPIFDSKVPFAKYISREDKFRMPEYIAKLRNTSLIISIARLNRSLKQLSAQQGILEKVTFHISRHSFADKARRMMKKDPNITWDGLRLLMAHSSFSTTQVYLDQFDLEGQDTAHEAIWAGSTDVKALIAASAQTLLTATSAGVCTPCVVKVISMLSIR